MTKRYQVFISSTFIDLEAERFEVSRALLRANCFPAGMEIFPAADEEQFAFIKEVIDESDYYIIISAGRYGSVNPRTDLSFTEMEYDYAVDTQKPIIRLLHKDPLNTIQGKFIENTDSGKLRLKKFRNKLSSGKLVRYWSDSKELGSEVLFGLEDVKKRHPAPGWSRSEKSLSYDEFKDTIIRMGDTLKSESESFVEKFSHPILTINEMGVITAANESARSIQTNPFKIGRSISETLQSEDGEVFSILRNFNNDQSNKKIFSATTQINRESIFFRVSIHNSDSTGKSTLLILFNSTEIRSIDSEFIQSQRSQAIGQLASGIAQDFSRLIETISGHCDLLLLRHDPGDQDFADLEQINQHANRAASLVGQLLAYSQKQAMRHEILDIRETLADLTHLLNRLAGERISIFMDHDPDLPSVRADRRQIEQVIMNLVVNARDAMPEGGPIQISSNTLRFERDSQFGSQVVPAGTYVKLDIKDSGVGIDELIVDRVFDPFFSTKKAGEGSGLGLSTVYGIVRQTGGFVAVFSEVTGGSRFSVLLPEYLEG